MIDHTNYFEFQNTLPFLIRPNAGDSLFGFLLRLDYINMFQSGSVVHMIKKLSIGVPSINRPGLFLIGTIFDLELLSNLSGIPIDEIHQLTLIPSLTQIFRTTHIYPHLAGYSNEFKICPDCVKEHNIPLIHSFKNVDTCVAHKTKLYTKCLCGKSIMLFKPDTEHYSCPNCSMDYRTLPAVITNNDSDFNKQLFLYDSYKGLLEGKYIFIRDEEDLNRGFEGRLQYLSYRLNLEKGKFKQAFGYDASKMKNGHGPSNLSLSKILDILYELNLTINDFQNLVIPEKYFKIQDLNNGIINVTPTNECPNIYCIDYNKQDHGNIKNYGRKKSPMGIYMLEQYCTSCGTRFFGNNIIQSYDYNPGMRYADIEKAQQRIVKWKDSLTTVCLELIDKMIPITLTGAFKKAGIPIGKTYFIKRLGLIDILKLYSNKQRAILSTKINEIGMEEYKHLINRIYRPKKKN